MAKYLDASGLNYFWGKIIDYVAAHSGGSQSLDGIDTQPLARVNLWQPIPLTLDENNKPEGVCGYLHEWVISSSDGTIASYDSASHSNYSGIGVFPATRGKYYVIYNPYNPSRTQGACHVGVINSSGGFSRNLDTSNILLNGQTITIVKGIRVAVPDDAIQALVFQLYYKPKSSQTVPSDFSLIEIYELESDNDSDALAEALAFVHAKYGETHTLGDGINLEQKLLDVGGTLNSVIGNQSCMVFGDSICADHTWSDKVACALKMHEMYNVAIGGANINGPYMRVSADDVSNVYHVDLIYQILHSPVDMFDVCEKFGEERTVTNQAGESVTAKVKTIDNVIIAIGTNNTGGVSYNPSGDLDTVLATPWEDLLPTGWDWNNLDSNNTSFADIFSAIKYCIMLLRNRVITAEVDSTLYGLDYTNARIVWQTPVQRINTVTTDGVIYIEYPEVLVGGYSRMERIKRIEGIICDMCEALAVPVINGRTMSGISMYEEAECYEEVEVNGETKRKFIGKNLRDGVHMTAAGYDRLAEMHIRAMLGGASYQSESQQSGGGITIADVAGLQNALNDMQNGIDGKQDTIAKGSVTIAVSDWSGNTCTVTATGVTASNTVIVSPDSASMTDYAAAGVQCTAQGANTLTFTCTSIPTSSITINFIAL